MYLLYVDESGTSTIPGNTSHFILTGISIPNWHWKNCDNEISTIKQRYDLSGKEIHTAWILRNYLEQSRIPNFETLNFTERRSEVLKLRNRHLLNLQRSGKNKQYKQTKKNYNKTKDYIHLTYDQRKNFINAIAECVSNWGFARLFAECIDKVYFDALKTSEDIDYQAFEQIICAGKYFALLGVSEINGMSERICE